VLVVLVLRRRSSVRPCLRVLDGRLVALAAFSSFSASSLPLLDALSFNPSGFDLLQPSLSAFESSRSLHQQSASLWPDLPQYLQEPMNAFP
jgi:hypothetical protein